MTLNQWIIILAVVSVSGTRTLRADETADTVKALKQRIEALDQKVRVLERKDELNKEVSAEKAKTVPSVSIGSSGFTLRSADTNFVLKLRGLLQVDSRTYLDDGGIKNNDTFLLRRARPIFEGTVFRDFDFLLTPEFGGTGTPSILDAYLNYRYQPGLQLRMGKFKVPVGLEQLQSDSQALFIERGYPSQLTPNRDLGVQLHGELGGVLNYAIGAFNGVGDNRTSSNADFDDEKAVAGRIFLHPFQKTDLAPLKGLGFGVGASFGNSEGANGLPNGNGYVSDGVQQFFSYTTSTVATNANVTADGAHWRISPQAYWYYGPFGLLGEYVISSQKLRRTSGPVATPTEDFMTARNTSWQIEGTWVLTGEDASYKGVTPKKNFDPHGGGWGAFDLVARYGVLDIDDDVFAGPRSFASAANSASKARSWGVGLNWYLNRNIRAAVNYFHTDFQGGETGSNLVPKQNEQVFLTRLQLSF
jgi:phosphate-selective porin OprO and OprP